MVYLNYKNRIATRRRRKSQWLFSLKSHKCARISVPKENENEKKNVQGKFSKAKHIVL